jgi:hypothetical protein
VIVIKNSKNFRLDSVTTARLEALSIDLRLNQTELIDMLINACFDESWDGFKAKSENKGFDRLVNTFRDRKDIIKTK